MRCGSLKIKLLLAIFVLSIIFSATISPVVIAGNEFILTIGSCNAHVWGTEKYNDVAPILVNGRTMLPARFVAENLGASVSWDAVEKQVTVKKYGKEIVIYADSAKVYVNGKYCPLDANAFIQNGRTYVPVRFLVEKLGASVKWDGSKNQVIILRQKGTDTYAEYPTTLKSQDEWRKILENDRELIEFYGGFHLLDVGETGGIYQYAVYYHNPRNGPTLCGMMYLNPYSGRYRFNDILNNEKLSKVINK